MNIVGIGTDIVECLRIAQMIERHGEVVIGRVYHHTVKLLFGLKVRDVDCDFRLMRRRIFDVVRLEKDSGVICLEMMKKFQDAGFRVAEHPVSHYHRAYGKSQFFNFRRIARTAFDVARLWFALVVIGGHKRGASATVPDAARRDTSETAGTAAPASPALDKLETQ